MLMNQSVCIVRTGCKWNQAKNNLEAMGQSNQEIEKEVGPKLHSELKYLKRVNRFQCHNFVS